MKLRHWIIAFALIGSAVHASTLDELINRWLSAQTNIQTWSADFVQIRQLKALVQPLRAPGHLWYAAPSDFRWELGKPVQTIAARHGDELILVYPNLKRAERYSLGARSPGQLKDMLSLLEAGFPRSRAQIEDKFKVRLGPPTNNCESMILEPKSAATRKMLPEISVVIDTNNLRLKATELKFTDGSTLRNEFEAGEFNSKLEPKLFQPELGPDIKVAEPLHAK